MKHLLVRLLFLLVLLLPTNCLAESIATVRVPMCLQFPDKKIYVPCTGVVPVDVITGNAMNWGDIFGGSADKPIYTREVSRRTHWSETYTPLAANQTYTSTARDDGGTINGGPTRLTSFSCFALTDQTGTLNIQGSDDGSTWITFQSRAIAASTGIYVIQPLFTKYWRCQVVNGNANQGILFVKTAFGM